MRRKAIWVEAVSDVTPLSDKDSIRECVKILKAARIDEAYVQVYREGRAWFRSSLADPFADKSGLDPLQTFLAEAGAAGIEVHAWINVFNLGSNERATVLARLGRDALLTDSCGVRIDAYGADGRPPDDRGRWFALDAAHLWLDPASPEVFAHVTSVADEIVSKYPEISGLHLDFVRYPFLLPMKPGSRIAGGFDWGYGARTRERFEAECGVAGAFVERKLGSVTETAPADAAIAERWDAWRRAQVSRYLPAIRKKLGGEKILSIASVAFADRAYLSAFQDWRGWLDDREADRVCLMSYTPDDRLFSHLVRQGVSACGSEPDRMYAGIGAWFFDDVRRTQAQDLAAQKLGAGGTILFSYGNLRKKSWDMRECFSACPG